MASESAILGTPAIYINNLELGYLNEQEKNYKLVYNYRTTSGLSELAQTLVTNKNIKIEARKKAKKLVDDCIDLTSFILEHINRFSARL